MSAFAAVALLMENLAGEVVVPNDRDDDTCRKVFNAIHDKRPAVIAR